MPDPRCLDRNRLQWILVLRHDRVTCACAACIDLAVACLTFCTGCRCDACAVTHLLMRKVAETHPGGTIYFCPARNWPRGQAEEYQCQN